MLSAGTVDLQSVFDEEVFILQPTTSQARQNIGFSLILVPKFRPEVSGEAFASLLLYINFDYRQKKPLNPNILSLTYKHSSSIIDQC